MEESTASDTEVAKKESIVVLKLDGANKVDVTADLLNSWEFNTFDYSNEELQLIVPYFFKKFDLFVELKIDQETFTKFTAELCNRYLSNHYHNFFHSVDVLHAVYMLTTQSHMHKAYSKLEVFSLLLAAAAHDVGHLGVNNVYLVKAKHSLAITYNDTSPLESMHCAELYRILCEEDKNIFSGMSEAQWRDSRKMILPCILGTDMTAHFTQIKEVQSFKALNGEAILPFSTGNTDEIPSVFTDSEANKGAQNRLFMMVISLHCADISNPYKPKFDVCRKWADLIVTEFCEQGDREKLEGLEVSPMCDRDSLNLYNMQMGFIEFVVAPLIIGFINILPALHNIGRYMKDNMVSYGELRKEELKISEIENKDEEIEKLEKRITKFGETMSFLEGMKASCATKATPDAT